MKKFWTVFKFEYGTYLKSRAFIVVTALFLLIVLIGGNIPVFKGIYDDLKGEAKPSEDTGKDKPKVAVLADKTVFNAETLTAYIGGGNEYVFVDSLNGVEEKITNDEYKMALHIDGLKYTLYLKGSSLLSNAGSIGNIDTMIKTIYQYTTLADAGLPEGVIVDVMTAATVSDIKMVGKDLTQTFFLGYAMIYLMFIAVIFYGAYISTSVVTEKSSKAMELLITSVKPIYLIFGKVIGAGMAGLTQLGALVVVAVTVFKLNVDGWTAIHPAIGTVINMGLDGGLLIYMVVFFMLGFFSIAFLFAATASTASRVEDAQSANMIPTLLMTVVFVMSMLGMTNPDMGWLKVLQFVPFFSPFVLYMRMCVTEVPIAHTIIAIPLNVLYVVVFGYISTKIYRVGVMLYGTKPSIKDLIRYVRQA